MTRIDRGSERGAALLTVLLLVAVIAVLAATALEKLRIGTRLTANSVAIEQARGYAMAAETLATTRIDTLLAADSARVTLAGGWSGKPYSLPVPGGIATATVVDGGNCFNLNGLVTQGSDGMLVARPASIAQLTRLMRIIGIPEQTGGGIAAAAADWIDSDTVALAQGAEDSAYANLSPRYRTANTLMADPSELRAVAGVTPAIYAKLRPWICTQPRALPSRINVNTLLPEQAPLFAMLLPETLDIGRARTLLLERPAQGFTSTVAFWQRPALSGVTAGPEAQAQTAVTTQWFSLKVEVALGGTELTETALIDATRVPVRLVSRQWGDPS
ncbi:MAG: hypothetical protein B7Y45_03785 [Sphingomonas sp. 28-66-16]|nr:MAG: hypothetical protein B7Y45_03785 [Sphingomonas sp. 28-66-16]